MVINMQPIRKSSLFLIELMIAILFFSVSVSVCVRVFALSYEQTKASEYGNEAMMQAQSIAEYFRNEKGDVEQLLSFTGADQVEEGKYIGTFGGDYKMILTVDGEELLPTLEIQIVPPESEEVIFTLHTSVYQGISTGGMQHE